MRDFSYCISCCLFFLGYSLFILGVCSNAWKFQSGYDFGLWYRCDQRGCSFYEAEFTDYVTVIRVGISVTAVIFSIGVLCLCLEICLKLAKSISKHRRRIGLVIDVTTFIAEVIITAALAYYGHRTIKDKRRLPHLLWGFAVTGVGVISAFVGSILRAMGPIRSWDYFVCLRKSQRKAKSTTTKKTQTSKKTEKIILKGGKRYSKPALQKKDIVTVKTTTMQAKTVLPYKAPGVPHSDSYESLISNPEPSAKAMPHKYEEIPQDQGTIFFRADHNMAVPRPVLVRRPENQYQISVDRSPRIKPFHTLPPPPTLDPLANTVAVHSDSGLHFDPPSSRYQISIDHNHSPRMRAFHTLPPPPPSFDPLDGAVAVHSDSGLNFDPPPSTSMHSFVYDWP